jgi:hypothetical protein
MPLSRLENFLKNAEGNILYVNPSDFDATDSFENRGNSLTRPFRTIQRALLEAARFSYLQGRNNDKIDTTTILVYPGTHYIDNRPGFSITNNAGTAEFKRLLNFGWTTSGATISEFSENSNFDIFDEDNDLYKFNSVEGGVILPRGTSIVGLDLRKTKIRPLYVPDPLNDSVSTSGIFKVTGTCYFTSFSIFDADILRSIYKDSSGRKVVPNFSHHKLTVFEYADGVNFVTLGSEKTTITDLEMYYAKVTFAYGDTSGRGLANFPAASVDFEPSVDEYRIVGDLRADPLGITSIRAGDGLIPTRTITVTTAEPHGLYKDTPVLVSGITTSIESYNGSLLVSDVPSATQFQFLAPVTPDNALPAASEITDAIVQVESDSVSSASPYVFSCTLRSVYGMNGLHADGSKATGFKSMLTAQFTGISLQKDDNAFIVYDPDTGIYNDNETAPEDQKPLHTNSRAIYKSGWESTHMKCSNNSIIQCVSIFAIGFGRHFVAESGGDQSITNSNSNFGAVSLEASGFRPDSFDRDDVGYITHIIPPREPVERTSNVTWLSLDAQKIVSAAKTERLYIFGYTSVDVAPPSQIDSYRIGSKRGEELYLSVIIGTQENNFKSPILMQVPSGIGTSSQKVYSVGRNSGINSISSSIFTLTNNHQLFNGEKVRVYSDTGETPNNVRADKIYYAYTTGLNANQVRLSSTLNDTNSGNTITGISNGGGQLKIVSSVSDKIPGDPGHPIQYDTTEKQWYILGSQSTFFNTIYPGIVGIGTAILGNQTGSTFIVRKLDNRGLEDRIYKVRYVIPKEFTNARPPTDGFTLQESKSVGVGSASFLSSSVVDPTQLRNPKIIVGASYLSGTATIKTELPHNLVPGDRVKITNVVTTNNLTGSELFPYNGSFEVYETPSTRTFTYIGLSSDPGTFLNQTNQRTTQQQIEALPLVQREKYKDSLFIYRSQEVKRLIPGGDGQDGIYNLTLISGSIKPEPSAGFGISERRFNQDVRNLYPQQDRDNFISDPEPTISYAELSPLGKVSTNDKKLSLTREALQHFLENNRVGYAITGAAISGSGNTTVTLYTNIEHGLNSIKSISLVTGGLGYNNSAGVTSTMYSAELVNVTIDGKNASVKASISIGNTITSVTIVDSGSAYAIGNTMTVSSSPAAAPSVNAVVQVTDINSNIGDSIELNGFADPLMNGIFKIQSIPNARTITIENRTGLGATYFSRNDYRYPQAVLGSKSVSVSTATFTKQTGITTITCTESHGLVPGNTFVLVGFGSTNSYFSKRFLVSEVVGINTFTFSSGITTLGISTNFSGVRVLKGSISANGKSLGVGEENLGGRTSYIYAGITTTLNTGITAGDSSITFTNSDGFKKGDYVIIGAEIIRLSNDAIANTFTVSRGQFATVATSTVAGSQIKKIRVIPMELRRPSILRASGHTFEYLGFGPGNYSTGLPLKQDRILSSDEILVSQAREQDGGTVVYTGMNDRGEFYSGAKKINGATGEEEVIEAPIVSFFGDDAETDLTKRNSGVFDDIVVKERITVEGGENNNQTSQFYGPVNFSQKVTNSSEDGLETRDLYIKGVASQPKLLTVGISTPTQAKKSGDISLLATPDAGGYLGHIYADGDWRRFGMVSKESDSDFMIFDKVGIGQSFDIYDFKDALEVNGTVKVKNLYVGGAVTFAGAQAIGNAAFEVINVDKVINFAGIGTNYTIRTTNANTIAQFQNLEVTGYAATFTNATVRFENSFNSVFSGISTIAGTLNVNNLTSTTGVITATSIIVNNMNSGSISISTEALITSGIITAIRSSYIGGLGNAGVGETSLVVNINSGIITTLTGSAATITTLNATNAFITGLRANTSFATPLATINTGIITNFSSTTGVITNFYSQVGVVTTLIVPTIGYQGSPVSGWFGAPTAYVNTGFTTTAVVTGWMGAPTAYVNTGIVTTLYGDASGTTAGGGALYYQNARIGSRLWLSGSAAGEGIFANAGIISAFGPGATSPTAGSMNINCGTSGDISARRITSTIATGASPFVVTSTTKVDNLNADLLDGLNTSSTDITGSSVVTRTSGDFSAKDVTVTNLIFGQTAGGQNSISNAGNGYLRINGAYVSSGFSTAARFACGKYVLNSNAATFVNAGGEYKISATEHEWNTHTSGGLVTKLMTLDNSGNLTVVGYGDFLSDESIKTNIKTIENGLDKVSQLRGVEYDRTDIESHQIGVIAQEVEKILPEVVRTNEDGLKSVAYPNMIAVLIEAIKELKGEISELKEKVAKLEADK